LSSQECCICPVVDYQCSKHRPEIGVGEASIWFRLWIERNVSVLPLTPSLGSQFARLPIGVSYQSILQFARKRSHRIQMSGYRQTQEANFSCSGNSLFSNIHFGLIVLGRRIAEPMATKRHYLTGWFILVRFAEILVVTSAKSSDRGSLERGRCCFRRRLATARKSLMAMGNGHIA
jgi:hypothetical protein